MAGGLFLHALRLFPPSSMMTRSKAYPSFSAGPQNTWYERVSRSGLPIFGARGYP